MGDGGGRCEDEDEVEGRDRLDRALVGEVGVMVGGINPRWSMVGVKRLPAARSIGMKRDSGCGGDKGPAAGWMIPEGSEEGLNVSGRDVSLVRRDRDDTRESFSSGEGKRWGSSGECGWRMCANEEARTGADDGWKEEGEVGEMSLLRSAATVARRWGAWAVGAVVLCGIVGAEVEGGG